MDPRYLKRIARYAAEREQRASRLLAELDVNDWFDYWHLHPDYRGRGNRVRPLFALLTYQLLQQAEALMAVRGDAVQVWAVLAPDTGNHGVYIHSENPAGNYPCDFAWVSWGVPAPEEVASILHECHEVGCAEGEDGPCYYIRRKA